MSNTLNKMKGYKYNKIQFEEIIQYDEIRLYKKIINKTITKSKNVSNSKFKEFFEEYNTYIQKISNREDLTNIEKNLLLYKSEKSYNIQLYILITEEAQKYGFKTVDPRCISLLCSRQILTPQAGWWSYPLNVSDNWFILKRQKYVNDLFNKDELWWRMQEWNKTNCLRMLGLILYRKNLTSLIDELHNISEVEKEDFLAKKYNICSEFKKIEWNERKISYFRNLPSPFELKYPKGID